MLWVLLARGRFGEVRLRRLGRPSLPVVTSDETITAIIKEYQLFDSLVEGKGETCE